MLLKTERYLVTSDDVNKSPEECRKVNSFKHYEQITKKVPKKYAHCRWIGYYVVKFYNDGTKLHGLTDKFYIHKPK